MRLFALSLTLLILSICHSSTYAQVVILPTTPCDAAVDALPKVVPTSVQEDGTVAFMYGPDNKSFVSVVDDELRFNVKILFEPQTFAAVKLNGLNDNCDSIFGVALSDIIPFGENSLIYSKLTEEVTLNNETTASNPNGILRYVWVEALDAFPNSTVASYSYVIDIQSPENPTLVVLHEDFNDNSLSPKLWSTLQPPPGFDATVAETNEELEIAVGPGSGGGGIVSNCSVAGDFDVQVGFELLNWPSNNTHNARLGATDLGEGPFGAVGINRSSFNQELYVLALPGSAPQTPSAAPSGKLRLVRTGSTLEGRFHNGTTWVAVGSGLVGTNPTRFNIDLGSADPSAPGGVSVAFDDFKVNSGTLLCPGQPCNPPVSVFTDNSRAFGLFEGVAANATFDAVTTTTFDITPAELLDLPFLRPRGVQFWVSIEDIAFDPTSVTIEPNEADAVGGSFSQHRLIAPGTHASYSVSFCRPATVTFDLGLNETAIILTLADSVVSLVPVMGAVTPASVLGFANALNDIPLLASAIRHYSNAITAAFDRRVRLAFREAARGGRDLRRLTLNRFQRRQLRRAFVDLGVDVTAAALLRGMLGAPARLFEIFASVIVLVIQTDLGTAGTIQVSLVAQ